MAFVAFTAFNFNGQDLAITNLDYEIEFPDTLLPEKAKLVPVGFKLLGYRILVN